MLMDSNYLKMSFIVIYTISVASHLLNEYISVTLDHLVNGNSL